MLAPCCSSTDIALENRLYNILPIECALRPDGEHRSFILRPCHTALVRSSIKPLSIQPYSDTGPLKYSNFVCWSNDDGVMNMTPWETQPYVMNTDWYCKTKVHINSLSNIPMAHNPHGFLTIAFHQVRWQNNVRHKLTFAPHVLV